MTLLKQILGRIEVVAYVGAITALVALGVSFAALSLALVVVTRGQQ